VCGRYCGDCVFCGDMRYILIPLLFAPIFSWGQPMLSEANYRIYSVKEAKEVPLSRIAEDMAGYDVLFFGEEHNDSVTHYLEAAMLRLMHEKYGSNTVLSMEMFERDVQTVMDEYLSGAIREKHFNKDARIWSNYRDYKPMVEFAKEKGLPVICANAPARYTNLAGRKGQQALAALPSSSKEFFAPVPYDTATGGYYNKLMGLSGHTAPSATDTAKPKAPPMAMMGGFNLVVAQSLWDATMAYSIASYLKHHKNAKVMQVNGKFHSDEGYAAATQLTRYRSKAKKLIISTASDDNFPAINWANYTTMGDYIIITDPKVPRTYEQ